MSFRNHRLTREEVHTSILQTARDIAAADGWEAVTVRKVAERIGYTAPIIYEHFGSKKQMLAQILKQGYEFLYAAVVTAANEHADSYGRLEAIAIAYWDFAHDAPEMYQLMYGMDRVSRDKEAYAAVRPLMDFLNEEYMRFTPKRATPEDVNVVALEVWGVLHGLISLDLAGYARPYADGRKVLEILVADVLYALKRKV
jgi:AcrR family transcriptional regulator